MFGLDALIGEAVLALSTIAAFIAVVVVINITQE